MERKAAFGRVELMGGYADIEQNAVDPVQAALRKRAKLDSEALVLGMNRRIEIWSSEVYEEFMQSQLDIAAEAMLNFKL